PFSRLGICDDQRGRVNRRNALPDAFIDPAADAVLCVTHRIGPGQRPPLTPGRVRLHDRVRAGSYAIRIARRRLTLEPEPRGERTPEWIVPELRHVSEHRFDP